ncbi:MAG TPA: GAF domain-containing protein [Polyangiaceae bacterium]|nr:GAF domain-containing protein [Polyangiaceae bacterium]
MAELDDRRRLSEFKARIAVLDHDAVLHECVEEAAERAGTKMAFVSLVLRKTQVFRAAVGLPPELERTRATSRRESFCQYVVRTESTFTVSDARYDPRVPQGLVDLGVVSYAGVPIRVSDQVLGSLCVADGVPRRFLPEHMSALRVIALRVSRRLEELASFGDADDTTVVPPGQLAARASLLADVVQQWLAEVRPMVALGRGVAEGLPLEGLQRAARVLGEASDAYEELTAAVSELRTTTKRVEQSLAANAARAHGTP